MRSQGPHQPQDLWGPCLSRPYRRTQIAPGFLPEHSERYSPHPLTVHKAPLYRSVPECDADATHDVRVHGGGEVLSFSPFSTAFASGGGLGPGKPRGVLRMFSPARSDGDRHSSATDAPSEKKIVTSSGGGRWGRAHHRWKAEVSAVQPEQSDWPKV